MNEFLPWQISPYFCHNGGIVWQGLCPHPWPSGAHSTAIRLLSVSWETPGALDLVEIFRERSRSVSETYRPLALARLYGEFCMVQFRYCMSRDF